MTVAVVVAVVVTSYMDSGSLFSDTIFLLFSKTTAQEFQTNPF